MVKRLRHRPFTAVTGVQIPLESFTRMKTSRTIMIWFEIFFYFIGKCSYEIKNAPRDRTAAERKMPLTRPAAGGEFRLRNSFSKESGFIESDIQPGDHADPGYNGDGRALHGPGHRR